jgi:hypothetical protein
MRRAILVATFVAILASAPAGALAGKQTKYTDLAALQPPPNPNLDWDCWVNGKNIVCEAGFVETWDYFEIDDLCAFSFYSVNGSDSRKIRRVHDLQGRQLYSTNLRDIRETLSLNPDGSGPTLRAFGHFTVVLEFGMPGDVSTRTETFKGTDVTIVGPKVGLVLHDNGLKTYDIDDNLIVARGPHPVALDFEAAFQNVCAAFEQLGA